MVKFYQQVVSGKLASFDGSSKIHSKKIYKTPEQAEAEMDEFIERATTPKDKYDIFYLDKNGTLKTKVVELELQE